MEADLTNTQTGQMTEKNVSLDSEIQMREPAGVIKKSLRLKL